MTFNEYNIRQRYFLWLCETIGTDGFDITNYSKLLDFLNKREFYAIISHDDNRLSDGLNLRYTFGDEFGFHWRELEEEFEYEPCSVLEMMVALASRLDDDIMYQTRYGVRISTWFWIMISNLGLIDMDDDQFDYIIANQIIDQFLSRNYCRNGRGGLFVIETGEDATTLELWALACRFADAQLLM